MWIGRYEPRWHRQVVALADSVFGKGHLSSPWEKLQQPDSLMFVACGDGDDTVLGFAHGAILPEKSLRDYLGPAVGDFPKDIADADEDGNLAVIDVVAVSSDARRQGVGYSLLQATQDALVGAGADKLVISFKRGPGSTSVEGLMKSLGYDLWEKLPSYWRDACNRGDFKCVERKNTCVCEAMLFRKSVY
jgi:GNAT superfamily N-acetyltransferase